MADLEQRAEQGRRAVTVFGGTGFLGRRIVQHLLEHQFEVRAASRHPEWISSLPRAAGAALEELRVDIHDEPSVGAALAGAYGAVNAVSLYVERGRTTFEATHVTAAGRLARLARQAGVKRLVHVSGIGADPDSPSDYISARGRGEVAVQAAFPGTILVRPAVMFAADDAFLTALVRLIRGLPLYPLFGRGATRLQPVFVEDVAEAIARILDDPRAERPCYELGGPRIYTYAELLRSIADQIGVRLRLVPVPFSVWEALAWASEFAPGAPLTRNQVALIRQDTVAAGDLPGLRDLGIEPMAVEEIVPALETRSRGIQPS